MSRYPLVMLLVLFGVGWGVGCSANKSAGKVEPRGLAERGSAPPLSSAELNQQYSAFYAEGLNLIRRGEYGLALGAFERALKLQPESAPAMFNLGACYEAMGDPAQAIILYRRVLLITPDDPDCYANLGTSFIKMYYRERSPAWRKMARDAWQRSLELKPGQADLERYLAEISHDN